MTPESYIERQEDRRRAGKIIAPCVRPKTFEPYPVTTPYGIPGDWAAGRHTGEDHAAPTGSLALATSWGKVIYVGRVGWGPAYGTQVHIRTGDGAHDYALCHLSKTFVRTGMAVRPGQTVGLVGSTGNSTGPHLHLEARPAGGRYGTDVNPIIVKRKGTE